MTTTVTPRSDAFVVAASGTYRTTDGQDVRKFNAATEIPRALARRFPGLGASAEVEVWRVASLASVAGSASAAEVSTNIVQPHSPSTLLRPRVHLFNASGIRLVADVESAGGSGLELRLEWSVDGESWSQFAATNQPKVALDETGAKDSGVVTVPAEAKDSVWLRLMGAGGAGSAADVSGIVVTIQPSTPA